MGIRIIPFGIAVATLGFLLKSPGTQAGPVDLGSRALGISVFGTIHPGLYRIQAPIGSHPVEGVRVASLDPAAGTDPAAYESVMQANAPEPTCGNVSFEERFAALEDRAASFHERFASVDDRPASHNERFAFAMKNLAGNVRLPADFDAQKAFRPIDRLADAPSTGAANKHVRPGQAHQDRDPLPDDGRTAIYDITARAVYLPNGRKLEAHSGLGAFMDSPRHVHLRMRGATPPNVYKLTLRESLFHGVRAIRLNPVDGGKMYGRAGILAHTYMLGPNGQSNGCVSFKNYPEFLNAYLKGEVTRLVVVDHLDNPPGPKLASGWLPDVVKKLFGGADTNSDQYAAATSP